MQQYNCPNCGAPLIFRSSVSVHSTCTYCQSMVVRHDMKLETLGKVAELLDDMSPFQVSTMGSYKGRNFTLVGRIKVVYPAGTWSEWYALFDDGAEGWLAEAQGNYMMSFPTDDPQFDFGSKMVPMDAKTILGETFYIDDVKFVTYVASEGELPYSFIPHQKARSIDLRSEDGKFASIAIVGNEERLYVGEYASFDSFNFQNLRTLDGW